MPGRCGRCAGACAFSGAGNASAQQVCCLVDASTDVALPGSVANGAALPALFLSFSAARELRAPRTPPPPRHTPPRRDSPRAAAAVARPVVARHPAARHRDGGGRYWRGAPGARRRARSGRGARAAPPAGDTGFALDAQTALGFVMATLFLLGLYALLALGFDVVVLLLVWLFVLASVPALATLVLTPSIRLPPAARCRARSSTRSSTRSPSACPRASAAGWLRARWLCALALAAVGVLWYVERRAPWAWVLQDVLGATLCCSFLRTLSLPSLRVRAVLGRDVLLRHLHVLRLARHLPRR